ncbi:ATP synthase subunit I [Mangrovicoccus sp. HB161399]|uniref:N-ATPase subunit AtpR n=1 Tax=Mangrovicoccus sp. HB161399 TaxID=2720392 RepID=UPI001C12F6CF|nr:ATP synthase subunit I [Mangrovicoccus sp. HB161399]
MTQWLFPLLGLAAGFAAGMAHFLTLRRVAELWLEGRHPALALLLQAGRLVLLGCVLAGLAMLGALPLLCGAAGVTAARSIVLRRAGKGA